MRIAYIAHYQGPTLMKNRPSLHNLSLALKVKIELIAELLREQSHEIELISQGEVDRMELKFYPALNETEPFNPAIPVFYASAWPIRFVRGIWSGNRTLQLFKKRHRLRPFDLVIIHNMKAGHIACAKYATSRLKLPVVLEYEDDLFVDVRGENWGGLLNSYHRRVYGRMLKKMSGCMAVSPHLLAQLPAGIPKLLLRGVVSQAVIELNRQPVNSRPNRAVFSGTHEGAQGLEQMIWAWMMLQLPGWELHLAGKGAITPALQKLATNDPSIIFHGVLDRTENARLLCSAKIGMNPQDVTRIPGTSFAFKIIEYLAAGLHVITTPRGMLEPELETGITYIDDNTSETIAASLNKVISSRAYERTATEAALRFYGPETIAKGLDCLVKRAAAHAAGASAPAIDKYQHCVVGNG